MADAIDYFQFLFNPGDESITLPSGRAITLHRMGLGRHLQLQTLEPCGALCTRVEMLHRWCGAAGITDELLDSLPLTDLPALYAATRRLNSLRGLPAWQRVSTSLAGKRGATETLADYQGRMLARMVDTLARNYGWELREILDLPPEVALAHVQECLINAWKTRSWEHYLSEMSWEYSKADKKSHYRPLTEPEWMRTQTERREYAPIDQRIIEKYYPKGVIVDLTKDRDA